MSHAVFSQVMQLLDQLSIVEQHQIVQHLQTRSLEQEVIIAAHQERIATGAFEHVHSLRNRYATPNFQLTEEELSAGIRDFANEWEKDHADTSTP